MSVEKAYKKSMSIYDGIMTQSSLLGKIYMNLLWSGTDDNEIAEIILKHIPNNFDGNILEVPVGTAVFTSEKWKGLSNSKITCLDYSEDMLEQAKVRLSGWNHIDCVQGDVSNLHFDNETFDIVVSMNGFHVFPDKNRAYNEICRVLKKGGIFIACFYIKGQKKHTDIWVEKFLAKKGWFSPPFQTFGDVDKKLKVEYENVYIDVDGSMVYFKCTKK